jgi:flagellar hook-associated protein 2
MEPVDKANRQTAAIMKSLDVGSGVDIENLARSLADAENLSRINALNQRKASVETQMSAHSIVASFLNDIKQNFDALKNAQDLFALSAQSSDSSRMPVRLLADAPPGQYTVEVQQLAGSTALQSLSFAARNSSLNGGNSFSIAVLRPDNTSSTIVINDDTPAGVVAAINASGSGIRATLINKSPQGDDWQIVLQGATGSAADFNISSGAVNLGFDAPENRLASAQDALITVNGLTNIARSANTINDVIPGAVFELKADPGQAVSIRIERNTDPMSTRLQALVDSYNQFNVVLDELTRAPDKNSDEFTGALRRDMQFVNTMRRQLKDMLTQVSSTPAGGINSLRDLGLTFKLDGTAEIDRTILNRVLASDPDSVAQMLSAGTNNTSDFSIAPKGLAQDISIALKTLLGPQGLINQRKTSGNSQLAVYERDLVRLEARLEAAYQRYILQFSAMESMVQRMQGVGKYLQGQFTAMENMYKN